MNKEITRILIVSLITAVGGVATHFLIKALDKRNLLPQDNTNDDDKN